MSTWFYKKEDGQELEHGFLAPAGSDDLTREVLFPLAEVQAPDYAANIAATVKQMDTFIQPAELTGNATINLTIDAQLSPGAKVHLKLDADASNRTVTLGTGFDAGLATIVVAATKVAFMSFVYDGVAFCPVCSIPTTA